MAMAEREKPPAAELVVGYVTAFLLFPIGLLIGIHVRRRDAKNGIRLILVSSAIGVTSVLFGVTGGDTALGLSVAVVAVGLGISFLAEGRREGGGIGGILLVGSALLFTLLVLFADGGDQGGPNRDEQIAHAAERKGEKMVQCLKSHPQQFKDCERRVLYGK